MDYSRILLFICPLVFLAGFIDAIAGGGGLISAPAYMAAGLPPHNVLACNKFSNIFGTSAALYKFKAAGHLHTRVAVFSVAAALIGSALGASLTLMFDDQFLRMIMLFLLPPILIFILIKKDFGEGKSLMSNRPLIFYSALISFGIGAYDGFFGPGAGTFLIIAFTSILGYDVLTASGNAKAVNWASNFAALTVFLINGKVIFPIAIPAAICSLAGGYLGSKLAIGKGMKIIRPVFIVVILLLIVKIVLDFYN